MKRILLVDDDEIFNFISEQMIIKTGVAKQVDVCISGMRALQLLRKNIENSESGPEIILLDIRMPVMSGFDFLDEFNKLPAFFIENIKIAMLSSSLEDADVARSFKYKNVIEFINKPLTEPKINELISKVKGLSKYNKE